MMRKKMLTIVATTLCTAALIAGCGSGMDGTLNSMQTESSSSSTKVKTTAKPAATSKTKTTAKPTATSKTKATTKPKTTTKPTVTPKAASNLPKPMDEVFSYLSVNSDDSYDDYGNPFIRYKGCEDTEDVLETIEKYIDYLKDYGYTQSGYKETGSSYYTYYLKSSDSSLATLTFRDETCHMAIEGWANDRYGWKSITVCYSPDIVEEYRDVDGGSNGGGGGGGINIDDDDDDDDDHKCINCNGTGSVTCKTCNGDGRVSQIVTVPKYTSGVGGTKNVRKTCDNCNGSGKKSCSACGGDGIR